MAANNRYTGIKHSKISSRTHETTARGSDWIWFLVAVLAVVAIFPF